MIKLIAAITMLIDHIGVILFPDSLLLRIVGRISMPLFAYCIARGFYYSRIKGTEKRYCRNMILFATVSQVPFYMMCGKGYNIGYTWLFSLLLLMIATWKTDKLWKKLTAFSVAVVAVVWFVEFAGFAVDYGVGGIATPLLFYLIIAMEKESAVNYAIAVLGGWGIYCICSGSAAALGQVFSVLSIPVLAVVKRFDRKIKLPKWFFYGFYPVHILVLLLIRYLIS